MIPDFAHGIRNFEFQNFRWRKNRTHDVTHLCSMEQQKPLRTVDVVTTATSAIDIDALFLSPLVTRGLTRAGFVHPSPVQMKAIPLCRAGADVVVQAKSGTGKTCVFAVAMLELVVARMELGSGRTAAALAAAAVRAPNEPLAISVAPTREIAVQICDVVQLLGAPVLSALRSALASIEVRCSAVGSKAAKCGSTAAVLALTPQLIVAANLGDSRAVLVRRSAPRMPIALTLDDKPDRMDEKIRVEAAGGVSTPESARDCARVGHANVRFRLAMSRALGDFSLKLPSWVPKPILLSTPTLTAISLRPGDDELLIVASDGVWDVLTNEQACAVARAAIRRRLSGNDAEAGKRIPSPAEAIVDIALQRRSSDNCTCVVVEFDGARGSGEEEGERAALQEGGEADTVQVLGGLDASIFQREMLKMNGNPAAKL
jgi:serine/threonine protein phosphatase PrpC